MIRLSRKALFTIEAVLDIAFHAGAEPVQSREITRRQGIPRRYLEQALQDLVRHGVLVGVRGPRGGYRLARERRRITVGQIVRIVRNGDAENDVLEEETGSVLARQVVRPLWRQLTDNVLTQLDNVTLDDLCDKAHLAGIRSEGRSNLDFSI